MDRNEIDSFVNKFRALCDAGYHASLNLESKLREVYVNLSCKVGRTTPPPPFTSPAPFDAVPKYRSPSYYRRQARRKATRVNQVMKMEESRTSVAEEAKMDRASLDEYDLSTATPEEIVESDADQSISYNVNVNSDSNLSSSIAANEAAAREVTHEQDVVNECSDTAEASRDSTPSYVSETSKPNDDSRRKLGMVYYAFVPPPMK